MGFLVIEGRLSEVLPYIIIGEFYQSDCLLASNIKIVPGRRTYPFSSAGWLNFSIIFGLSDTVRQIFLHSFSIDLVLDYGRDVV